MSLMPFSGLSAISGFSGFSGLLKPVAVASAIAFSTLGVLSTRYQKARFYFNSTIFLTTLGAASLWGLLISVVAAATGNRFNLNYYVARSFYRVCHPLVGIDFDIEGQEHIDNLTKDGKNQSAVIIGNHQSMVDILYLGAIFPRRTSIMAKKELQWSPILGQYMTLSGAVFINRGNRKDAVAKIKTAGEDMKRKGISLWIFPEGTRTSKPEPSLLPFKMGAFHLAIQAQVPVVVCVCENYNRLFDGSSRFDGGRLKIKILPPIPTAGMKTEDAHKLADMAREQMLSTLKEISRPWPEKKSLKASPSSSSPSTPDEKAPTLPAASLTVPVTSVTSSESLASKAETTEDEMDDDAVLLKKPASASASQAA